jgi:hypothetical protein
MAHYIWRETPELDFLGEIHQKLARVRFDRSAPLRQSLLRRDQGCWQTSCSFRAANVEATLAASGIAAPELDQLKGRAWLGIRQLLNAVISIIYRYGQNGRQATGE